jgi:transposase
VASERNLEALRRSGGLYLVGTPRTLLRKVEAALLEGDWKTVREGIEVKQVPSPDGSEDTFILCRSADRRQKEAAIHDRFEKRMEERLARIQVSVETGRLRNRDVLQQRLGRLKLEYSRVARVYGFSVEGDGDSLSFSRKKDQAKADYLRHSEGAYLLRSNLKGHSEQDLWTMYMQLNDAEAAFRTLKQDLSIRPIYHQLEERVKAHVLVCFLAYAMYRTLDGLAKAKSLGMTARKILAALGTIKSGDIILPLVDGRVLRLRRISRPDARQAELLTKLGLELPERVGTDSVSGRISGPM